MVGDSQQWWLASKGVVGGVKKNKVARFGLVPFPFFFPLFSFFFVPHISYL